MNEKNMTISDAEWAVMKALWESENEEGLTLREIADAASVTENKWGYSTVRTMVGRLADKGVIAADKSRPGNFRYFAAVTEEKCKKEEVKNFIDRVFDGSASLLVASLMKDRGLTEEEEKILMELIDKME